MRPTRGPRNEIDVQALLPPPGAGRRVLECRTNEIVYSQGDSADSVMYIHKGGVQLSVVSGAGKQAIVATLGAGDFFGEGALADQPCRFGTAIATCASTILAIEKGKMATALHDRPELSDRFIAHMLARNVRIEADLVDHLFNSSEKRLARTLMLLAQYGEPEQRPLVLSRISQEALAEMVGTTRSRVNYFMNKFKKLGFIEYDEALSIRIHPSLLSVVLHD